MMGVAPHEVKPNFGRTQLCSFAMENQLIYMLLLPEESNVPCQTLTPPLEYIP